jgi:hypothetical protein
MGVWICRIDALLGGLNTERDNLERDNLAFTAHGLGMDIDFVVAMENIEIVL